MAAQFLKAKLVLPMHYNTFPPIRQDPAAFVAKLAAAGVRGEAPDIGSAITI
jgi:L-ascorbate metabolism protein UlaG (beta-lactamase superfamily)